MTMERLLEGPVQQWEPDAEAMATIESMLASEDELTRAYGEAYQNGCWVREWVGRNANPESGLTAVGDFEELAEVEFRIGAELDHSQLSLGDCMALGAFPGLGATRVERVRDGMRQILEARACRYNLRERKMG